MKLSRWRGAAATLALGSVLLAGCTGSTGSTSGASASPETTGSASGPASGTPSPGTTSGTTGSPVAMGSEPLGAKYDWSRFDVVSPYLKSLSGSSTFYELVWCDIEKTEGQPDWSTEDAVARKAQSVGAKLMLKIRVGSCWATAGNEPQFVRGQKNKTESFLPTDMAKYTAFVKSVVQRYKSAGVQTYAVENEINSASFWGGTSQQYETLLTAAVKAIKEADPAAKVADPGISSTAYGAGIAQRLLDQGQEAAAVAAYNTYYARRIGTRGDQIQQVADAAGLRAALASDQGKRNLEYLALAQRLAQQKLVDIRQVHFYESWDAAPLLVDYVKATTPPGMPVEAWEVGQFLKSGDLPDDQRAQEMVKTVSTLLAGGFQKVLWLPLVMNPTGRNSDEPRYGLLDPNGSARPTGTAYVAMAEAAAGATATPVTKGGLSGVAFEKDGRTQAFVWAASDKAVTLSLPGGDTVKVPQSGAAGSTTVSGAPVQISSSRPAAQLVESL